MYTLQACWFSQCFVLFVFKQVSLSDYSCYKSGLKIVGYSGFCLPFNKYKVYGKEKIPHICLCSNFYLASSSLPKKPLRSTFQFILVISYKNAKHLRVKRGYGYKLETRPKCTEGVNVFSILINNDIA